MLSPVHLIIAINGLITVLGGVTAGPPSRIVQGSRADLGEFPFIISLRWSHYGHMCGGSIISSRHVLTAAHCVEDFTPAELNVASGFINQNDKAAVVTGISEILIHPKFISKAQGGRVQNDIAVLTLAKSLDIDGYLQDTIKLPNKTYTPKRNGIVAGWGYTQALLDQDDNTDVSDDLNKMNLTIITHEECREKRLPPFEYQICATNSNSVVCKGDSGGPLVVDDVLVGVLSTSSCLIGSTSAFMDVYYFKEFIEESMREP